MVCSLFCASSFIFPFFNGCNQTRLRRRHGSLHSAKCWADGRTETDLIDHTDTDNCTMWWKCPIALNGTSNNLSSTLHVKWTRKKKKKLKGRESYSATHRESSVLSQTSAKSQHHHHLHHHLIGPAFPGGSQCLKRHHVYYFSYSITLTILHCPINHLVCLNVGFTATWLAKSVRTLEQHPVSYCLFKSRRSRPVWRCLCVYAQVCCLGCSFYGSQKHARSAVNAVIHT